MDEMGEINEWGKRISENVWYFDVSLDYKCIHMPKFIELYTKICA